MLHGGSTMGQGLLTPPWPPIARRGQLRLPRGRHAVCRRMLSPPRWGILVATRISAGPALAARLAHHSRSSLADNLLQQASLRLMGHLTSLRGLLLEAHRLPHLLGDFLLSVPCTLTLVLGRGGYGLITQQLLAKGELCRDVRKPAYVARVMRVGYDRASL